MSARQQAETKSTSARGESAKVNSPIRLMRRATPPARANIDILRRCSKTPPCWTTRTLFRQSNRRLRATRLHVLCATFSDQECTHIKPDFHFKEATALKITASERQTRKEEGTYPGRTVYPFGPLYPDRKLMASPLSPRIRLRCVVNLGLLQLQPHALTELTNAFWGGDCLELEPIEMHYRTSQSKRAACVERLRLSRPTVPDFPGRAP